LYNKRKSASLLLDCYRSLLPRSTVLDANGLSGHGDPSIVVFDGIEVDEVIQTRAGDTISEEDAPQ
jgi:hypothetical protein